ncbi:hypothetical protein [Haliangium sp.]|uniref:hypothetical protein n=1 Tax=Haliangium sp. TaxID=2663208 RepID=UPI003D10C742
MLTHDELVEIVGRYYPSKIEAYDPEYEKTSEFARLQALLKDARVGLETRAETPWRRLFQQIKGAFVGHIVWDRSPPMDAPCYECRVYMPWVTMGDEVADALVVLVSLLAPVYVVYAAREGGDDEWIEFPPLPHDFAPCEERLVQIIEASGLHRLSTQLALSALPQFVPHGGCLELGQSCLVDCLFTWRR